MDASYTCLRLIQTAVLQASGIALVCEILDANFDASRTVVEDTYMSRIRLNTYETKPGRGISRVFVSISAKSKKTPRQKFLSALMSETSGDAGEELAQAFARGHTEKLRELLDGVVDSIVKKAGK